MLLMHADARAIPVKDGVIRCCVTSPPYWRLRDYGVAGQIGMERSLDEYIAEIVAVLHEVRRVLTDDGTCWLNLGDKFKHKQLLGVPWRVALALQADGWRLRSDIVWYKPNPMPESVKDRPTRAHEYVFLLTKENRYYYDAKAIRTPQKPDTHKTQRWERAREGQKGLPTHERNGVRPRTDKQRGHGRRHAGFNNRWDAMTKAKQQAMGANARSVWTIAPEPFNDWGETSRLSRVASDALSDDTTHIVFPGCPEHADLARQLATHAYGEHAAGVLNDIGRTDGNLVRALLSGCAPTAPSHALETTRRSWDLLARECARLATLRNNGTSKTDPAPATTAPCIAFSEMSNHTDDRLTQLVWFALHASMLGSSIVPDDSDAHSLARMLCHNSRTVSSSCCCQFYHTQTEKVSHFATFPTKLAEKCVLAGSAENDFVLDPFAGSGTVGVVCRRLNRRFVGLDLSKVYCEMTRARVAGDV